MIDVIDGEEIIIGDLIESVIICLLEEKGIMKKVLEVKYLCVFEFFFDLDRKLMMIIY